MIISANFTTKIIAIVVIVFTMIFVSGYYAYNNFSKILNNVIRDEQPDSFWLKIESLMNDVEKMESGVVSYVLTEDSVYIDRFYPSVNNVDEKCNEVRSISKLRKDSNDLKNLCSLVENKVIVLDSLFNSNKIFRVDEALNKVTFKIDEAAMNRSEARPGKKAQKGNDEKKINKLIDKLFKPNQNRKEIDKQKLPVYTVRSNVENIRREEQLIENQIKKSQLELIENNRRISIEIQAVLSELKLNETKKTAVVKVSAKKALNATNRNILFFCVVTGIFLITQISFILNYVAHNNKFKKVLKEARNEALALSETKERFFANMSHEIRTPMNAIAGFSEQLSMSDLNEEQRDQVELIEKSVEHLLYLINDVLDYSKMQAGKLKLEKSPFNLDELVNDILEFVKPLARDKKLELISEGDYKKNKVIIGDPVRLKQILLNLITNSIKFTDKGSIYLNVKTILRSNDRVTLRFTVKDTGIGMSQEQVKKVFREFEQAEETISRNYGGTGLGLTITKKLVELYNGAIYMDSKIDEGTEVIIEIPFELGDENMLNEVEKRKKADKNKKSKLPEGLKVLVVDDEDYNIKLMTAILKKYNLFHTSAFNGQEAVEEVERGNYDVVLMDARMPVMDGVTATEKIRTLEDKKKSEIPIIALTAAVTDRDKKKYKISGMNGFLAKPFKENDLIEEILNVLEINMSENGGNHNTKSMKKIKTKLNYDNLMELSQNDNSFMIEMLEIFLNSSIEGFEKLEKAYENQDWGNMAEYAHKMCSPCRHLSATNLHDLLKIIEQRCREKKELDSIGEHVKNARNEFEEIKVEVEEKLKTLKVKGK